VCVAYSWDVYYWRGGHVIEFRRRDAERPTSLHLRCFILDVSLVLYILSGTRLNQYPYYSVHILSLF